MKFYVYKKQEGEGCDYTIGCGQRLDIIEADSLAAAVLLVQDELRRAEDDKYEGAWHYDPDDDERLLETCLIIPAEACHEIDLERFYDLCRTKRREVEAKESEAQERAQLEQLQRKYAKK